MKSEENVVRLCCFSFHRTPRFLRYVLLGTSVIVGTGHSHGGMGVGVPTEVQACTSRRDVWFVGQMGAPGWFTVEVPGLVRVREKTPLLRCL